MNKPASMAGVTSPRNPRIRSFRDPDPRNPLIRFIRATKVMCFLVLMFMLAIPALAQNTKGDKPAPDARETRFKTPKKSPKKSHVSRRVRRQDDKAGRRIGVRPSRSRSRKGERAGKPITPQFSKSKPDKQQKPWKGDITGRRIRPQASSSRAKNVYPQPENINYSSRNLRRKLRNNENPNVKRVQRMQRQEGDRPRVGKPIRPTFHKSRPQESQRAWRGDITGRPFRARRSDNVRGAPVGGAPRMQSGRARRARQHGIRPMLSSGRARNIFSRRSFYVNNQSRTPPRFRARGNEPSYSLDPSRQRPRIRDGKIIPRSASASFLRSRSINAWAHFKKPQRSRAAHDRDLAGHRLRAKNYETPRQILTNPTLSYRRRMALGERPYKGPAAGGHISKTRAGRAWKGDVARRAIRGGQPPGRGERAFLGFLKGGGFRSATSPGERAGGKLKGRAPGQGAKGVDNYTGNIRVGRRGFSDQGEAYTGHVRARRAKKGGGSVSGGGWNNNGLPILGKAPGKGSRGVGYSGNLRTGKRGFSDQGEEYSGNVKTRGRRRFGNQGEEYSGNIRAGRRGFSDQGEEYTGNIKAGRRGFSDQGEEYTGNIRARRPDKGGGSRGGHWNNNNTPIVGRAPHGRSTRIAGYQGDIRTGRRAFADQGEEYAGDIKAHRPKTGGGSVSRANWNNDGRPIPGKSYSGQTKISRYSGNLKAKRPEEGGGSVSGKLWNNKERPLPGKDYSYARKVSRYSGNVKAKRPEKSGKNQGYDFAGDERLSRNDVKQNPKSAEGALRSKRASATAFKADIAVRGSRRSWDYIKNPSSADEAQRTREPGRAFTRSGAYQGNLKVKRSGLFDKGELHPDAQFVKLNKNNVPEEKDVLTNLKLWWARLFKKEETQPDHLKEKGGRPRYDKGEAGLWYE